MRGQVIDELPVNLGRRHLRRSGIGNEIPLISEACHESVQHICCCRDRRSVVGERIAEAEPREGWDHQVKSLVVGCIFRLGKQVDDMCEGKVRKGERGYQQKRQRIAMGGRNMDAVESQRGL